MLSPVGGEDQKQSAFENQFVHDDHGHFYCISDYLQYLAYSM